MKFTKHYIIIYHLHPDLSNKFYQVTLTTIKRFSKKENHPGFKQDDVSSSG